MRRQPGIIPSLRKATEMRSISVEVMDQTFGRPAEGVPVALSREVDAVWQTTLSARTDATGSIVGQRISRACGRYRLAVDLDGYFAAMGLEPLVSSLDFCFRVTRPYENVRLLVAVTPAALSVRRLTTVDRPTG